MHLFVLFNFLLTHGVLIPIIIHVVGFYEKHIVKSCKTIIFFLVLRNVNLTIIYNVRVESAIMRFREKLYCNL